jgi:hypothetical protein
MTGRVLEQQILRRLEAGAWELVHLFDAFTWDGEVNGAEFWLAIDALKATGRVIQLDDGVISLQTVPCTLDPHNEAPNEPR